ncbi:MAG: yhjA [Chitinophagaceae bacterium]|nr:yhjA [Chitinophagaceae bacterium]
MNKIALIVSAALIFFLSISFKENDKSDQYELHYTDKLNKFQHQQARLLQIIEGADLNSEKSIQEIKSQIMLTRNHLKQMDFWFRYLEPISYKKINGPLPVEWETEVFEKFEKPYKREGAGLTLASLYLEESVKEKEVLLKLISESEEAVKVYHADSITSNLKTYHHFYLCNRLFLLNLATIYTTGFECPETERVIPELIVLLDAVDQIYQLFNKSFPDNSLPNDYVILYQGTIDFVKSQPENYEQFDHFTFIKEYINPLFVKNQKLILDYKVVSKSYVDYSLNKNASSIFSKGLYNGQNTKGVFLRVKDPAVLTEIDRIGKLLFYDPILSGNNMRSCASCHKPTEYFTDTVVSSAVHFNRKDLLPRNSPSLINVEYNHLIMLDGKHISLQGQTKDVIFNAMEMGSDEAEALKKILSCKEYKTAFQKLLAYTPQEKEITYDHVVSAITFYYSKFSKADAAFDDMMNGKVETQEQVKSGFNLFMSKAQCGTCHFAPQFNGVKPPYVNSEFEVLGVPENNSFAMLSDDKGRHAIHPAKETMNGFRTGTLRNIEHTKPYMHNGVFKDLREVIDFYDAGGGTGHGLSIENQTLSPDSLHLMPEEKNKLLVFLHALNEEVPFEKPLVQLPLSKIKTVNKRKVGGEY